MGKELVKKDEKYHAFVEEIKSTITEAVHNSRWTLIEGYWLVGKLMRKEYKKEITNLLQALALDIGTSERTLWYALKTYDTYPDMNKLPEGKNISWNKLITKYLSTSKKSKSKNEDKCKHCPIHCK